MKANRMRRSAAWRVWWIWALRRGGCFDVADVIVSGFDFCRECSWILMWVCGIACDSVRQCQRHHRINVWSVVTRTINVINDFCSVGGVEHTCPRHCRRSQIFVRYCLSCCSLGDALWPLPVARFSVECVLIEVRTNGTERCCRLAKHLIGRLFVTSGGRFCTT